MKVEYLIPWLIKHKLTHSQYYLLYCIYHRLNDTMEMYKKAYPNPDGSMIGEYLTNDLITRGFLIKKENGINTETRLPKYKYEVGIEFKNLYVKKDVAFNDLLKAYPNRIKDTNGSITFAKDIHIGKYSEIYFEIIEQNVFEHEQILKDLDFAFRTNMLNYTLLEWVEGQKWLGFRSARLKYEMSNSRVTENGDIKENE